MQSDERLTIETPEQVGLELPVAGPGSRFLAVAVDTLLQFALYAGVAIAIAIGARFSVSLPVSLRQAPPAVAILIVFCIYWGYFALFEILWSGRTPGKRVAGIRVIKESGRPITVFEALARNILRAVDFLPAMYGVGIVVMLLNRHSRRLGDFVAGTVVVYEAMPRAVASWGDVPTDTLPAAPMTRISAAELRVIETYLQRRLELDEFVRDTMAEQIAARVTETTGVRPESGQSADDFLKAVARRVRDVARFR